MKEIIVSSAQINQRLDKFLLKYLNNAPKAFVYKMLRKKRIKRNHAKAQGAELLCEGDTLQLYLSEETLASFMEQRRLTPCERQFTILFEDEDVMVVVKPAGLLCHPQREDDTNTLWDQLLYYLYEKGQYDPRPDTTFTPALCNRLDRNTSGIVLFGKTLHAVQALNKALCDSAADKRYQVLVYGQAQPKARLCGYLQKDEGSNTVRILDRAAQNAKEVETRYRTIKKKNGFSLLEVTLVTGRSHQIRAHLQSVGLYVAGDRKYGRQDINRMLKEKCGLVNQFLHASELEMTAVQGTLAYLNGKTFHAPLPKGLQICLDFIFREESGGVLTGGVLK